LAPKIINAGRIAIPPVCIVGKRPRNVIIKFPLGSAPHTA